MWKFSQRNSGVFFLVFQRNINICGRYILISLKDNENWELGNSRAPSLMNFIFRRHSVCVALSMQTPTDIRIHCQCDISSKFTGVFQTGEISFSLWFIYYTAIRIYCITYWPLCWILLLFSMKTSDYYLYTKNINLIRYLATV